VLSDNPRMQLKKPSRNWKVYYTDQEKLEAAKLYLLTGNLTHTAAALGIYLRTIQLWATSQWWKDLLDTLRHQNSIELSTKLRKIAGKALEVTHDRLENGDFIYDQKTGLLVRKPVTARDAARIATSVLDQVRAEEKKEESERKDSQVAGRLDQLAEAFAQFARKTTKVEVIDLEVKEETRAIHEEREKGL